jgi:hypothetical protein
MYLWQRKSPSLLGFYRPNQAMNTVYSGYAGYALSGLGSPPVFSIAQLKAVAPLSGLAHWKNVSQSHTGPGMGDISTAGVAVDPKLMMAGVGLLAAGMFLLGGKHGPRLRKRKTARLRRRLAALEG